MSKIITGIIIAVLVLGGAYFLINNNNSNDTAQTELAMEIEQIEESAGNVEKMEESDSNLDSSDSSMMEPTSGSELYEITDGSEVSYTAQKRFLSKEDAVVVGVSKEVSGSGWVNLEESNGFLEAKFDLTDLVSDSPKRDSDIIPLFADTEVKYVASITDLGTLEKNTAFSVVVPSDVTINNVTKTVEFTVTGTVGDDALDATGSATIMLSDFGLKPPSLAGIYTVDDEIEIAFDIKAKSIGMMDVMDEN